VDFLYMSIQVAFPRKKAVTVWALELSGGIVITQMLAIARKSIKFLRADGALEPIDCRMGGNVPCIITMVAKLSQTKGAFVRSVRLLSMAGTSVRQ